MRREKGVRVKGSAAEGFARASCINFGVTRSMKMVLCSSMTKILIILGVSFGKCFMLNEASESSLWSVVMSGTLLADKSGEHSDVQCSPPWECIYYGPNCPPKLIDHPAANSISRLARIQELTEDDRILKVPTTFESLR
jgi:hypothetical protein